MKVIPVLNAELFLHEFYSYLAGIGYKKIDNIKLNKQHIKIQAIIILF